MMTFNPATISNFLLIATGFSAAFAAALWLSLIIWTYRDIRRRSRDPLLRILAVLVVTILFLPGVLVYLILRPARTQEEEFQQTLEEEALLQKNPACAPAAGGASMRIGLHAPVVIRASRRPVISAVNRSNSRGTFVRIVALLRLACAGRVCPLMTQCAIWLVKRLSKMTMLPNPTPITG
jgi:hypothetical protein